MSKDQALLVMDVQNWVVASCNATDQMGPVAAAIDGARRAGVPVIHAHVGFRAGYPEISDDNAMFSAVRAATALADNPGAWAPHEAAVPNEDDVVVVKRRVSAFTGSDLVVVLRSMGIRHLALAGVATSGVVLSTLCEAADRDFVVTVLSDGCADPDPEVHRLLIEKVFPMRATVSSVEAWSADLG